MKSQSQKSNENSDQQPQETPKEEEKKLSPKEKYDSLLKEIRAHKTESNLNKIYLDLISNNENLFQPEKVPFQFSNDLIWLLQNNIINIKTQINIFKLYIDSFFLLKGKSEDLSKYKIFDFIFKPDSYFYKNSSDTDSFVSFLKKYFDKYYPKSVEDLREIKNAKINETFDVLIYEKNADNQEVYGWVQLPTKRLEGSLLVFYDYIDESKEIKIPFDSYRIQKKNKFCKEEEMIFRNNLKNGMKIDFINNKNYWVEAEIVNFDQNNVGIAALGEGSDQINYRNIFSPLIRPLRTFSFKYELSEINCFPLAEYEKRFYSFNYCLPFDKKNLEIIDNNNTINENSINCGKNFLIPVDNQRYYSIVYFELFNYFIYKLIQSNLFNVESNEITNNNNPTNIDNNSNNNSNNTNELISIEYIYKILEILYSGFHFINKEFMSKYFKSQMFPIIRKVLLSISLNKKKNISKVMSDKILTITEEFLCLSCYIFQTYNVLPEFVLSFGFNCFKESENLEKRILGLNSILCTLVGTKIYDGGDESLIEVTKWVNYYLLGGREDGDDIFRLLFGKVDLHEELVKKGNEIIINLAKLRLLDEKDIEKLYNMAICTEEDSDNYTKIYEVLQKISEYFTDKQCEDLVEKIISDNINNNNLRQNDICLIIEVIKNYKNKKNFRNLAKKVLDFLYNFLIEDKEKGKNFIDHFTKVISCNNCYKDLEDVKYFYIYYLEKIIDELIKEKDVKSIEFFYGFISLIIISFKGENIISVMKEKLTDDLNKNQNNQKLLENFMDYINSNIDNINNINNELLSDEIKLNILSIIEPIKSMLYFLKYDKFFDNICLDKLCDIFVFSTKKFDKQKDMLDTLLFLLKNNLIDKESFCSSFFNKVEIFINNINDNDENKNILINENIVDTILKIYKSSSEPKEDENSINNNKKNKNKKINPLTTKYFDIVWKVFIRFNYKKYLEDFLSVFSLKEFSQNERYEIWSNVIKKIFSEENPPNIEILLNMINFIINASEVFGTGGVVSHLVESKAVVPIKLQITTQMLKSPRVESIELTENIFNTSTLYDVKKEVQKKTGIDPFLISFLKFETEYKSDSNGKPLFNILRLVETNNEKKGKNVLKLKRSCECYNLIKKEPLIDEGNAYCFNEKTLDLLREIFNTYSEENKMTLERFKKYYVIINGSTKKENEINQSDINDFFRFDRMKKGYCDLEEFVDYYMDLYRTNKSFSIYIHFFNLGYRKDMEKLEERLTPENSLYYEENTKPEYMPRYFIGNNVEYMQKLFEYAQSDNKDIHESAQELIKNLCTLSQMKKIFVGDDELSGGPLRRGSFSNGGGFDSILGNQNLEMRSYAFNILKTELEKMMDKNDENKKKMINKFIQNYLGKIIYDLENFNKKELNQINEGKGEKDKENDNENQNEIKESKEKEEEKMKNEEDSNKTNNNNLKSTNFMNYLLSTLKIIFFSLNHLINNEEISNIIKNFSDIEDFKEDKDKEEKDKDNKDKKENEDNTEKDKKESDSNNNNNTQKKIKNINYILSIDFKKLLLTNLSEENKKFLIDLNLLKLFKILISYISLIEKNRSNYDIKNLFFSVIITVLYLSEILEDKEKEEIYQIYINSLFKTVSKTFFYLLKYLTSKSNKLIIIIKKNEQKFIELIEEKFRTEIINNENMNKCFGASTIFSIYSDIINISFKKDINKNDTLYEFLLKLIEILFNINNNNNNEIILKEQILIGYMNIFILILSLLKKNKYQKIFDYDFTEIINSLINEFLINYDENLNLNNNNQNSKTTTSNIEKKRNYSNYSDIEYTKNIFELLNIITNINPQKFIQKIMSKEDLIKIKQKHLSLLPDDKTFYSPKEESKSHFGYLGLKNLSSLCYMNSVIQQFYMIPLFRKIILNYTLTNKINNKNLNNLTNYINKTDSGDIDDIFYQLEKMFYYLTFSSKEYYNPKDFVYSFKDYDGKPTNPNIQCDAQEFMTRFVDEIEKSIKNSSSPYLCNNILGGGTLQKVVCSNSKCGNVSERREKFVYLSLDVKNNKTKTLDECLEKFIQEEKIEDYHCEKCDKKITHTKNVVIEKLPNFLVLHLQRILFNYDTFMMQKINDKVTFEPWINIQKYTTQKNNKNINKELFDYKLKGIVIHSGTAQYGHYYSIINDTKKNKWYKFNDTNVSEISVDKVLSESYSEFQPRGSSEFSPSAYLLIYQKKIKNPVIMNIREINEKQFDGIDFENMSKERKLSMDIYDNENEAIENNLSININNNNEINIDKNLSEEVGVSNKNDNKGIIEKIYSDENENINKSCDIEEKNKINDENINTNNNHNNKVIDKEIIILNPNRVLAHLISYDEAINYIDKQNEIKFKENPELKFPFKEQILIENIRFSNDKKIYNSFFNKFLINIVKNIKSLDDTKNYNEIIKIINSYIFEILVISRNKGELFTLTEDLLEIIEKNEELISYMIKEIISPKREIIFSNYLQTKDLKIGGSLSNYFGKILSFSIDKKINDKLSIEIFDYYLNKIPVEVTKKWTSMEFFNIFISIVIKNSTEIKKILLEKETLSKLVDFVMGKESPLYKGDERNESKMKGKFEPILEGILEILEFFERGGKSLKGLEENDRKMIESKKFYEKIISEEYDTKICCKLINLRIQNCLNFVNIDNENTLINNLELLVKFKYYCSKSIENIISTIDLLNDIFQNKNLPINDDLLNTLFGLPIIETTDNECWVKYISAKFYGYYTILTNLFNSSINIKDKINSHNINNEDEEEIISLLISLFNLVNNCEEIYDYLNILPAPNSYRFSYIEYWLKLYLELKTELDKKSKENEKTENNDKKQEKQENIIDDAQNKENNNTHNNLDNLKRIINGMIKKYSISLEKIFINTNISIKDGLFVDQVVYLKQDLSIISPTLIEDDLLNQVSLFTIELSYSQTPVVHKNYCSFFKDKKIENIEKGEDNDNTLKKLEYKKYHLFGVFITSKEDIELEILFPPYFYSNMEINLKQNEKNLLFIFSKNNCDSISNNNNSAIIDHNLNGIINVKKKINFNGLKIKKKIKEINNNNDLNNLNYEQNKNNHNSGDDNLVINCPLCGTPNVILPSDTEPSYKCSFCEASLFQ